MMEVKSPVPSPKRGRGAQHPRHSRVVLGGEGEESGRGDAEERKEPAAVRKKSRRQKAVSDFESKKPRGGRRQRTLGDF